MKNNTEKNSLVVTTLIISFSITVIAGYLCFNHDIVRDVAQYYAPMADAFAAHNLHDAFPLDIPILLSFLAGILCFFNMSSFLALSISSSFFYFLTIFPLYNICKHYVSPTLAKLGCLLYLIVPAVVKNSCNGQIDSGRIFFIIWSIYLVFRMCDRTKISDYLCFSIALTGLSLVRGEGIIIAFILGLWSIYFTLKNIKSFQKGLLQRKILYLGITVILFLVLISPRVYQLYQGTGSPALDYRQAQMIKAHCPSITNQHLTTQQKNNILHLLPPGAIAKSTITHHFPLNLKELFHDFFRGSFELYFPFFLFGIFFLIKKHQFSDKSLLLISVVIINSTIFYFIVIAHRFFLINIPCLMPFLLIALKEIYDYFEKKKNHKHLQKSCYAIGVLLLLLCCFDIGKDLYKNYHCPYYWNAKATHQYLQKYKTNNILCFSKDARFAYWYKYTRAPLDDYQQLCELSSKFSAFNLQVVTICKSKQKEITEKIKSNPHFTRIDPMPDSKILVYYSHKQEI
ncbi:MAG: glycosyltransferase family 39 protein [Lentisphaeria bacterium]